MYDAIVVGARCAGAPTAMLLARQGHRILLVDKDRFPSNMPQSTHLIHPHGVAYLKRWGLYDASSAGCAVFTRWTVDLHGVVLSGDPPESDGNLLSMAPRRQVLDGILAEAASAAGAEFRDRVAVRGLVFGDDGRVRGIEAKDASGRTFTETARIVVGADGPASAVARAAGAAEHHREAIVQSNIWSYWRDVPVDHVRLYIREKAGAFAFPSSERTVLVAANVMYPAFVRARRGREAAYHAMLAHAAPELREMVAGAARADRLYAGCTRAFMRRAVGPGWALVGDAGMKKDPVTAQGIAGAFEYAEKLAAAIDRGLTGAADLDAALADYERERDRRMLPFYAFTAQLSRFDAPTPEQRRMYERVRQNPALTRALFGVVSLTVTPDAFFSQAAPEAAR